MTKANASIALLRQCRFSGIPTNLNSASKHSIQLEVCLKYKTNIYHAFLFTSAFLRLCFRHADNVDNHSKKISCENHWFKMSFAGPKTTIEENDTVILYMTPTNLHAVDVKPYVTTKKGDLVDNVHQTSFGGLKIKDLIGVKYGSKVFQKKKTIS